MMHRFRMVTVAVALAATTFVASAFAADIAVSDPWARASAGMAKAGAAFMAINNTGDADRLVAAAADVSDVVELHTHIQDGEIMRMRRVDGIDVPAGETVLLQPGGLHVMFLGLRAPLEEGQRFPLTLTFETAGDVTVDVEIRGAAAMAPMDGHGHGHGAGGMQMPPQAPAAPAR